MDNQQVDSLYKVPNTDFYFCDEYGNVFSTKQGRLRKLSQQEHNPRGRKKYLQMRLGDYKRLVHRVVLSAKLGRELLPDEQANHIDGDTKNNRFDNLEAVTGTENVKHAQENGLYCSGRDWYICRGLDPNDYLERE